MSLCKLKMLESSGAYGLILVADGQGHVTVSTKNVDEIGSGGGGTGDTYTVLASLTDPTPSVLSDKLDTTTIQVLSDKLCVAPGVFASQAHTTDTDLHVSSSERSTWNAKQDALGFTPENSAQKGQPYGYASLDAEGKVPASQLPAIMSGAQDVLQTASAGEIIAQYAPVYIAFDGKVYTASNLDTASRHRVCGIATNAGTINQDITILRMGRITNPLWTWTDAPVFVDTRILSQTPPTQGYSLMVGVPIGPTTLLVKLDTPILL